MADDALYDALIQDVQRYIKKKENIDAITEAYEYAKKMHMGQMRRSGEPYITHPVAVARILSDLQAGPATLIAGLLHDVIEDTSATAKDIETLFGADVYTIVEGVTKLSKLTFAVGGSYQSDNHQKMLLAMAKDIRVVLVKIADRLHNMRTLDSMSQERQVKIAEETLEIYAPIAHRLGLFRIKAELEDRALRYTDPALYYKVSNLVKAKKDEREQSIQNIISEIEKEFKSSALTTFEIKGRIKNIYSIYKKMVKDNRVFEDIYDLLAIRIIVDKVEECYHALGIIHAHFTPIPRRFKDYIAVPKPNLYQSLHTTVLATDGTLFEVQIRTKEMDMIAENGIAAHWAYKENRVYSKEKEQFEMAQKLKWYGELLKMAEDADDRSEGSETFVETIKTDILTANVYVFTPKGEVIELPKGATPIDFAYRIHTDVGNSMVGAMVNNRIVTLDHELQTGDVVSVKTNKNSSGPSEDWLKIAKSSHARHKIKGFLNKINKDDIQELGEEILERELLNHKISFEITDQFVIKYFEKNSIRTVEELYLEIGKNTISAKTVVNKIVSPTVDKEVMLQRQMEKAQRQLISHSDTGVVIDGLSNPQIKLANCCTPVLGDDILGYVSKGSGIVIHAAHCSNITTYDSNRFLKAEWGSNVTRKYATWLKIIGTNRATLLSDIITVVNSTGISIVEVSLVSNAQLESIVRLKVSVSNKDDLNNLIANLHKVSQVYHIEREIR